MPCFNEPKKGATHKLTLKEFDGREAFWTGSMPYKSSVELYLLESDLNVTLDQVVGSYIPLKLALGSDGRRNLMTDRKKRVDILWPLRKVFEAESKEATLYVHLGDVFEKNFHEKNETYFRQAMKQLKESFDTPGFWSTDEGAKVKELMAGLDSELRKARPNLAVVQQNLFRMNKVLGRRAEAKRKGLSKQRLISTGAKLIFVFFLMIVVLGLLQFLP